MGFADKMKLLLNEKGMSQKDFASQVQMNYAHANKFFTGRTPNMEFLSKVKEVFPNVDLDWLLFSQEDNPQKDMLNEKKPAYSTNKALAYLDDVEENLKNLRAVLSQS